MLISVNGSPPQQNPSLPDVSVALAWAFLTTWCLQMTWSLLAPTCWKEHASIFEASNVFLKQPIPFIGSKLTQRLMLSDAVCVNSIGPKSVCQTLSLMSPWSGHVVALMFERSVEAFLMPLSLLRPLTCVPWSLRCTPWRSCWAWFQGFGPHKTYIMRASPNVIPKPFFLIAFWA